MRQKRMSSFVVVTGVALMMSGSGRAQTSGAQSPAKPAEQAFKNIQVLKGVPSDQVIPAMQFITASLGVQCEFCHEEGHFEKDDKKPKQTARKMMLMMFAINKDNFDGHREVTCYSCHRGAQGPVSTPPVAMTDLVTPAATEQAPAAPQNLPAAEEIIEKYIKALGGGEALQQVKTREEKGTALMGGRQVPIDIFIEAPDKRVSVMHLPAGDSVTAYNGTEGWLGAPGRPPRDMAGADLDAARLDADLYLPLHLSKVFSGGLKTAREEDIDNRSTCVVTGQQADKPPTELYFDQQSGLLLRQVRYGDSPLGLNATQIDYADYRDIDGVKIPYRWTIARPNGRFTIQLKEVRQNVPVDQSKFVKPGAGSEPSTPK